MLSPRILQGQKLVSGLDRSQGWRYGNRGQKNQANNRTRRTNFDPLDKLKFGFSSWGKLKSDTCD